MEPIPLRKWQRSERKRWMQDAGVRESRVIAQMVFVTSTSHAVVHVREYLLPDNTIVTEQYTLWQADGTTRVVMLGLQKAEPHRYAYPPIW